MRRRVFCMFAVLLSVATNVTAQTPTGVAQPGTVIRAELSLPKSDPLVGTLVSRTSDTLTLALRSGGIVKIANSALRGLDVSNGRRRLAPAVRWALIGGGIWGLISTVIPFESCDPARYTNCNSTNTFTRSEFVLAQALGMAVITGTIGAVRGDEAWTRIEGTSASVFIRPTTRGAVAGVMLRR